MTVCAYAHGGRSSNGRASALHAEGKGIDAPRLQNFWTGFAYGPGFFFSPRSGRSSPSRPLRVHKFLSVRACDWLHARAPRRRRVAHLLFAVAPIRCVVLGRRDVAHSSRRARAPTSLAAHARPGSFAAPEHESPEPPKAPRDATAPRGVERDATARNVPSRVARTGGARARWRVRTEASRRDDVRGGDADGGLRVRAVPRRVHRARGASRLRRLSAARGRRQGGRASRERRAARLRCAWRPGVARPSAALAARALDPPTRRRGASLPPRGPARTSPAPPRSRRERVRARPRRLERMRAPLIHSSPRTGTPPPRRSRANARTRVSEIRNADATPPPGPQTSSPHPPSLPLF